MCIFIIIDDVDDISRAFTIMYVFAGSTVVSGSIGVFISSLMSHFDRYTVDQESEELHSGLLPLRDPVHNKITIRSLWTYSLYELRLYIGWHKYRKQICVGTLFMIWVSIQ